MGFSKTFGFDDTAKETQEQPFIREGIFGESRVVITTDGTHPGLRELQANGQQMAYLVLPDEEIELGLIRPLRLSYQHAACGELTRLGLTIAQTFARRPSFYSQAFCTACRRHFALKTNGAEEAMPQYHFFWEDGSPVGT